MKSSSKVIVLAATSALLLSIGSASVNAAENPFAIKSLSSGYQVANHHEEKAKDGKCGEGKCGAEMKDMNKTDVKAKDGKCGEGKCGAEMKDKDMKKVDAKAKDGKSGY